MDWYVYVAWMLILSQLLFSTLTLKNYFFALAKYNKKHKRYSPRVALIIPCKNLDAGFEQNIASFYAQDYENYLLWFVVEDKADPAYEPLCRLKDKLSPGTGAKDVEVLIAGAGQECSQKIHNLLYAYRRIPEDIQVLAFADSDIRVKPTWLHHLVYPLRHPETRGAVTGYRWFVPATANLATLALSALNGKIAQLMGNTPFNHAWGGSMAIHVQAFRELGIENLWQKAVSDDFSLSCAVKDAHKKVEFVPGCLVATSESTTWAKLFEFGRRQFVITKVYVPQMWSFGLFSGVYSVFGLWGGAALAIYACVTRNHHIWLFTAVPILFFIMQLTRAFLRQSMASKLLAEDLPRLKIAAIADIALFWLWSPLMLILILSSAFGRTIRWRGIKYKLISKTETIVLGV
jgi:cellulose synthase/poly-beta-1,6-N-acetylglucosamine synthase-like glycosyltransferase